MLQETFFRITITFVFSLINYCIIDSLPSGQIPSFFLLFFMVFHVAVTLGLILQLPKSLLSLGTIIFLSGVFSYAITYVLDKGFDSQWGGLWLFQAEFSAYIIYCFYCSYFTVGEFKYSELFYQAWRILLTLVLASFFAFLVWGILALGSLLFHLIGLVFLDEIVFSKPMSLIGTPVFFAVGVSLLAGYDAVLKKCRQILLSFSKVLYPLLMVMGLLFFMAIPFATKPLTDYWSSIFVLVIVHLFLFNGVYQAGRQSRPYPLFFEWLMKLFFVLMPIYLVIAMQHPVAGLWAHSIHVTDLYFSILGGLLFLYTASYAVSCFILLDDSGWFSTIKPINQVLALCTALLFWLMATPLLDLEHLTS